MRPTSWEEVLKCECHSCKQLAMVYRHSKETNLPEYVCDVRMWGQGFVVGRIDDLFVKAASGPRFETLQQAVAYVLKRQPTVCTYESSWPLQAHGDFIWTARMFGTAASAEQ